MHQLALHSAQAIAQIWQRHHREGHRRLSGVSGPQLGERAECVACAFLVVWAGLISSAVKWLGPNAINPLAVDGSLAKAELHAAIRQWIAATGRSVTQPVIIVSYESLRLLCDQLGDAPVGLLMCDEAHRLKNATNTTYQTLDKINVKRRVLLTGTPVQNDLTEYFSLLSFANPGILGTRLEFRKNYENAILKGRDADASEKQQMDCEEKLKQLIGLVNKFVIRRTNDLLTKYCGFNSFVVCKSSDSVDSACQVRACCLLCAFAIPDRPLPPCRKVARVQSDHARVGKESSGRYWHLTEALRSPRLAGPVQCAERARASASWLRSLCKAQRTDARVLWQDACP